MLIHWILLGPFFLPNRSYFGKVTVGAHICHMSTRLGFVKQWSEIKPLSSEPCETVIAQTGCGDFIYEQNYKEQQSVY